MVLNDYRLSKIKLDIRGIRISAEEILFYTGLMLWTAQVYIGKTIYADFYSGKLLTAVRYFCMLIFLCKIVISEKNVLQRAATVFLVCGAVFVVVQRHINTGMPLIQILLMVYAARSIPFKRICKVLLWACIVCWTIPVLVDKLGIFSLDREIYKERVREFLNFNYVSFASIYFNNILFCTLYVYSDNDLPGPGGHYGRRREVPWIILLLFAGMVFWIYEVTDTSLPFLIAALYLFLYIMVFKFRVRWFRNTAPNRVLAVSLFPALALLNYIVAKNYNKRVAIMKQIDEMIHFRLSLPNQALKKYGVHLLGTQIAENTDTTQGDYFYVDSGFMKNLINYGLIVFILILLLYSVMLYAAILEHDKLLTIWLICVAVYSVFNNMLLSPMENGSLFAIWYAIDLIKWHKEKTARSRTDKRRQIEYGA